MSLFFYTQEPAFNYADQNNLDLIIARRTEKESFQYSAIKSKDFNKFFNHIKKNEPETLPKMNTMIREGQKDRLRLDIEIYIKQKKSIKKAEVLVDDLLEDLEDYLEENFETEINIDEMIISDASREVEKIKGGFQFNYKFSKHLLFNHYFETVKHQKYFWEQFLTKFQKYKKISSKRLYFDFDMSVYNNNSVWNETKRTSEESLLDRCPTHITEDMELIKVQLEKPEQKVEQKQENQKVKEKVEMEEEKEQKIEIEEKYKGNRQLNTEMVNIHTKNEIWELLNMLSDDRIDKYNTWIQLIFCLASISTHKKMKEIAVEVSKRSTKSNDKDFSTELDKLWKNAKNTYTIGTLYHWAKVDNPKEYSVFIKSKLKQLKGECLIDSDDSNITDALKIPCWTDLGKTKIIKALLKNKVKVVGNDRLYMVNKNNVWFESDCKSTLIKLIAYNIQYILTRFYYDNINFEEKADIIKNAWQFKIDLQSTKTLKNVLTQLVPLLQDNDFPSKLDSNVDIFAFNDKKIDLKTKIISPIKPEDHISITTGYNYPIGPMKHEKEIEEFFEKIHPNPEQREYVIKILASSISGRLQERFYTHAGKDNSGGGGKTMTCKLMAETLGKYAYCMPSETIYKRFNYNPQSPQPHLLWLQGKRFVWCSEPDSGQELSMSFIKLFTGGESITARKCNSNIQQTFYPQSDLSALCNKTLHCDAHDGGFIRRNRLILYESRFVDKESEVDIENNIYLKDLTLQDDFKSWRHDFIRILINNYTFGEKIHEPTIILENSQKYLDFYNDSVQFKNKYMVETNEKDAFITLKEIKTLWKNDDDFGRMKSQEMIKTFKTLFKEDFQERKKIYGKDYRNVILGYKLRDEDEEDNNQCLID